MLSRRAAFWLVMGACGAGAWSLRRAIGAAAAPNGERAAWRGRYLIVNADDFGMAEPINRGIAEAHAHGIVTSTSMLVNWPGAEDAVRLSERYPHLSVGLHVDLTSLRPLQNSPTYLALVRDQIERQHQRFLRLMHRSPTHLDSHHHVHIRFNVVRVFIEMAERYGLPLRGVSPIAYIGGFYGQWPPGSPDLERIGPDALISLLEQVGPGVSQIGCHPGYRSDNVDDGYASEREEELRSLVHPRVRAAIAQRSIRLINHRDCARLLAGSAPAVSRAPARSSLRR